MSEIKRKPHTFRVEVDGEGNTEAWYCFDPDHTWEDVARWVWAHGPNDVEELYLILEGYLMGEDDEQMG